MKKLCVIIWFLIHLFAACNNDEDMQPSYVTPEDMMKVTVSSDLVKLEMGKDSEIAVTFKWHPAIQRKAGGEVVYYIKYWLTADKKTAIEKLKLTSDIKEFSLTHKDLYDYIVKKCNVTPGETVNMNVEIIAKTQSSFFMMPEISVAMFAVATYQQK